MDNETIQMENITDVNVEPKAEDEYMNDNDVTNEQVDDDTNEQVDDDDDNNKTKTNKKKQIKFDCCETGIVFEYKENHPFVVENYGNNMGRLMCGCECIIVDDDYIVKKLDKYIDDLDKINEFKPPFNQWGTEFVDNIIIGCISNNVKVRTFCISKLSEFLDWYYNNHYWWGNDQYYPEYKMCRMYKYKSLKEQLNNILNVNDGQNVEICYKNGYKPNGSSFNEVLDGLICFSTLLTVEVVGIYGLIYVIDKFIVGYY